MQTSFRTHHNTYICAEPDDHVIADRPSADIWETFTLEKLSETTLAIKSFHGKYLAADPHGNVDAGSLTPFPWEYTTNGRSITLKSTFGLFLCAEPSGLVIANRTEIGPWETFESSLDTPKPYNTVLKTFHNTYICAEPSGLVVADRIEAKEWETFAVETSLFNYDIVYYRSHHGSYLSAQPSGSVIANTAQPYPWKSSWEGSKVNLLSTFGLFLCAEPTGLVIANRPAVGPWEQFSSSTHTPGPSGSVRKIEGQVSRHGRSFADSSGPCIIHGCSDFAALVKFHEDRDKSLRELDVISQHQQYVRVLWRLNGWLWGGEPGKYPSSGLTVDPIRDGWFDDALRGYLQACHDRGLRVNLSTGDMFNWSHSQSEDCFRRVAQIAASISPDVVWLGAAANELRGTSPGNSGGHASNENLRWCEDLMRIWEQHYPWGMRAITDDGGSKVEMKRASGGNATCSLIHDVRWTIVDALRRCFNTLYENYPDKPVVQDEPTGPNGSPPHNEFTRKVYQPTENHSELLALYTMHIITGQASTYFNDPALVSREPIDDTWGFKEIPAFWRQMEIPQDIGQGVLTPGHKAEAPLQVTNSGAQRADSMVLGNYNIGIISGGQSWKVRSGKRGRATAFTADGVVWEDNVDRGQTLPVSGPIPTIIRIIT